MKRKEYEMAVPTAGASFSEVLLEKCSYLKGTLLLLQKFCAVHYQKENKFTG